jgi:hypothetical protein
MAPVVPGEVPRIDGPECASSPSLTTSSDTFGPILACRIRRSAPIWQAGIGSSRQRCPRQLPCSKEMRAACRGLVTRMRCALTNQGILEVVAPAQEELASLRASVEQLQRDCAAAAAHKGQLLSDVQVCVQHLQKKLQKTRCGGWDFCRSWRCATTARPQRAHPMWSARPALPPHRLPPQRHLSNHTHVCPSVRPSVARRPGCEYGWLAA